MYVNIGVHVRDGVRVMLGVNVMVGLEVGVPVFVGVGVIELVDVMELGVQPWGTDVIAIAMLDSKVRELMDVIGNVVNGTIRGTIGVKVVET